MLAHIQKSHRMLHYTFNSVISFLSHMLTCPNILIETIIYKVYINKKIPYCKTEILMIE